MKRIVVGVDGSPIQTKVVAAAVELARAQSGQLLLVRSVSIPVEVPAAALSVEPALVGPLLVEEAQKSVSALEQTIPPGLCSGSRVVIGTPWRTVCDAAKELEAQLIVVGSHGYGTLDRLLGTTAARVVNHAPCSVLVVR